jgi:hypothetical protein
MSAAGTAGFKKKLPRFSNWLMNAGAELLAPTNQWEVLRFRHGDKISIIYTNDRGEFNFAACDKQVLNAFLLGTPWNAGTRTKRKTSARSSDVRALLLRDGSNCFLCGFPVDDDATIEHLVPLSAGGPNHLANYALAHARCNGIMGSRSLMEKIKLRDEHQSWHVTPSFPEPRRIGVDIAREPSQTVFLTPAMRADAAALAGATRLEGGQS